MVTTRSPSVTRSPDGSTERAGRRRRRRLSRSCDAILNRPGFRFVVDDHSTLTGPMKW